MSAQDFLSFARNAKDRSPLYAQLAWQIADAPELLALCEVAAPGQPKANLFFAAVQRLLRDRPDEPLRAYYRSFVENPAAAKDAYASFHLFALDHAEAIKRLIATRRVNTNEMQRAALLLPAFCLAAEEGQPLHLIEIGTSAGFLLSWHRCRYRYGEVHVGDGAIELTCTPRSPLPTLAEKLPAVGARIGLDLAPTDVGDEEEARWLEALIWPEQVERRLRLRQAIAEVRRDPPQMIAGDALESLSAAFESLPRDGLAVIFHSFCLVQWPDDAKARLMEKIHSLAKMRPLVLISLEQEGKLAGQLSITWPGREEKRLLAEGDPHGSWIDWKNERR